MLSFKAKSASPLFCIFAFQIFFSVMEHLKRIIEAAWDDRLLLEKMETIVAIEKVIALLDAGELRVAEPLDGEWKVNEWVKKAVILYFPTRRMETLEVGMLEFHDKIPLKKNYAALGVRVVPHAIARYGAFLAKGVIMMPSYVILVLTWVRERW